MPRFKPLTILHSNDMHGDFLAEEINDTLTGGISMLSGYVSRVRSETPNTLYCIAGDMFRGSVIDTEFRGTSTIELMNVIAPDVVTLGNHETDYGIAHLLFLEKCAKFPIINANLYIKSTAARLFRGHIVLEVGGMKVLFIGIITEAVMRQARNEGLVGTFLDIHEAAEAVGRICDCYNATDIDLTVLLTHIGFEQDLELAAQLDPAWGVDLIIGGHSHTLPEAPAVVNNVVIVQAGIGTDQIGRFDLTIDTENNCLQEFSWQAVPINATHCPRDEAVEQLLQRYRSTTDRKYSRIITRLRRRLTHPSRHMQTELGSLLSDILCERLGLDAMLLSSGSIRNDSLGPLVLYSDLVECFPYDEDIRMLTVTGRQLRKMLSFMLAQSPENGVFQISKSLKVVFDLHSGTLETLLLHGSPLADDRRCRIGLQRFQYNSFQRYFGMPLQEIEDANPTRIIASSSRVILEEYLAVHAGLDFTPDERLILRKD